MIALTQTEDLIGNIVLIVNKDSDLSGYDFILDKTYAERKIKGDSNEIVTLTNGDSIVVLVVLNKVHANNNIFLEDVRRMGGKVTALLNGEKVKSATVDNLVLGTDAYAAYVEGGVLANYQFNKYKKEKNQNSLTNLSIKGGLSAETLNEIVNVSEAVYHTRDMVNEPVLSMNAKGFSDKMVEGGNKAGYTSKVLSKSEIEELNMGGLLGVNLGSIDDPTFNILEWKPEGHVNERPLIFVGKGVVYDTGGNNIKTGPHMAGMKADMGGGAAVSGAIYAIAKNKLPLWVISLIPATDNRIGKNALVADDVITISDGTTVEVKNTDAEGRLILADALVYAKQFNPELVIDMATLTGAAYAITGSFGSAMVQVAEKEQVEMLKDAGEISYERVAEMPFWREYDELLKSNIADMSNLGGPIGGAITAGKFLHHFTDYNWIHLDIAGPSFIDKDEPYISVGGTGAGARLGYLFAKMRTEK